MTTETRGRKRKNRNYISFKSFEEKFDCSPYERRKIVKEHSFTVAKFGTMKRLLCHEVDAWEKECNKLNKE